MNPEICLQQWIKVNSTPCGGYIPIKQAMCASTVWELTYNPNRGNEPILFSLLKMGFLAISNKKFCKIHKMITCLFFSFCEKTSKNMVDT